MTRKRRTSDTLPKILRDLPHGITAEWEQVDPRIIKAVRSAASDKSWPLLLYGNVGSGKSCVSALIYASWPNNNVHWLSAVSYTRRIQSARRDGQVMLPNSAHTVGEDSLWRTYVDAPSLLVVDDLGISDASSSQCAIVYELVDRRKDKPMVVSTNLGLRELEQLYDYRIASRLSAGTQIRFETEDRRPSGKHFCVSDKKGTS